MVKKGELQNIPEELRSLPQWVVWRQEAPNGRSKPTKVPYSPLTRTRASTVDPATWGTFRQVQKAYADDYTGIGFVFSTNDPYLGIDLDNALGDEGKIKTWAQDIIDCLDSYTEYSPSGKGIHIIIEAQKNGNRCKTRYHDGEVEMYSEGRYFTVTGESIETPPKWIEERQDKLNQVYKLVFDKEKIPQKEPEQPGYKPVNISDEELIEKARNAANGAKFNNLWSGDHSAHPSPSESDLALCTILAYWAGNDPARIDRLFRQSGLVREKWLNREKYRQGTISKAIRAALSEPLAKNFDGPSQPEGNEPAEVTLPDVPFPSVVMTGFAGDFARLYSDHLECPPHFFYMACLTCIGAILSGEITLESELRPQPRLYTVLLGGSADDRKSTAISKTVEFFEEAHVGMHCSHGVGSAEGLQKALKEQSRLLLTCDEFKQFISKCKIDSSVLLPCVNTLFEQNQYENQTRNSHLRVSDGHLCMLAASTTETYDRTWDSAFTDIGFNNRLFIVPGHGDRRFAIPEPIPVKEKRKLQIKLAEILKQVRQNPVLKLTTKARQIYEDWYISGKRSVHAKRLDTYAMRLMILLAVNEGKSLVDEGIVRNAIKVVDWQLAMRKLYDPINADGKVAWMEEKIRRQLSERGSMTDRKLKQNTNANRVGLWFYTTARDNLAHAGEIVQDKKSKKWRIV